MAPPKKSRKKTVPEPEPEEVEEASDQEDGSDESVEPDGDQAAEEIRVPEALDEPYQLFLQSFMTFQAMPASRVHAILDRIAAAYEGFTETDLPSCLYKVNSSIKRFSLEIRAAVSLCDLKTYYALVNTSADEIATEFGASYSPTEVQYLRRIIEYLLDETADEWRANKNDLLNLKVKEGPQLKGLVEKNSSIQRFVEDMWLEPIDSKGSEYSIGVRSWLELRDFITGTSEDAFPMLEERLVERRQNELQQKRSRASPVSSPSSSSSAASSSSSSSTTIEEDEEEDNENEGRSRRTRRTSRR